MSKYGGKLNWTLSAEVGLVANVGTVTVGRRWCTSMETLSTWRWSTVVIIAKGLFLLNMH